MLRASQTPFARDQRISTTRSVTVFVGLWIILIERVGVVIIIGGILAIILHAVGIRAHAEMHVIDRDDTVRIRVVIVGIADRHAATDLAAIIDQTGQGVEDLRFVEARPGVDLLVAVHFDHGEDFAPGAVLQRRADGPLEVGPAHEMFARRRPARRHPVLIDHVRAQLLDHAAGAVAVLVADAPPDALAAEAAAFAVDAFPCCGVVRDGGADEEADEGDETHFG